jgi:hypothetical protein
MTAEIDVDISIGPVRAIPIPVTISDVSVLSADGLLFGISLRESSGEGPLQVEGSVTSPAAGATIVTTPALSASIFRVEWTVSLQGTVAAADANNFSLQLNATPELQSLNLGAVGVYPQPDVQINAGSFNTINVKALAVGTVGAIYAAQIVLTPLSAPDALVELQDGNQPLAELSVPGNGADSRWFGPMGIRIRNQIKLHIVYGSVTGAVYARYER